MMYANPLKHSSETLWEQAVPNPAGYRSISPDQLPAHIGAVRLLDVRNVDETEGPLGRIAEAENIPAAVVPAIAADWDRNEPLALVCHSGVRSAHAAMALSRMGFRKVMNVEGGMITYHRFGLPVVRGTR